MISLFFKECKNISKSLVYIIFLVIMIFAGNRYFSGWSDLGKVEYDGVYIWRTTSMQSPKKKADEEFKAYKEKYKCYPYGEKSVEIPENVIRGEFKTLYDEYSQGAYRAYPFGFEQHIKLDSNNTRRVEEIIEEIAGCPIEKVKEMSEDKEEYKKLISNIDIDYSRFKELMNELNEMIGKDSEYDSKRFESYGERALSYEEAVEKYNDFLNIDGITEGFARFFCDNFGIFMSLLPIFIVVFVFLKDRRNNIEEIIYSSKIASAKLIISRYLAIVVMCIVPVLILAMLATLQVYMAAGDIRSYFNYYAFIKYSVQWILPSIMIVTALGMILTLLTNSFVAIVVQMIWWFYSMCNADTHGNYGLTYLIIRFNSIGNRQLYYDKAYEIAINRIFYVVLSLALLALSIVIFELKRRGKLNNYATIKKLFKISRSKHKNMA